MPLTQPNNLDRPTLADLTVAILFSGCIGNLSLAGVRVQRPGNGSMGSRKYQLTFNGNPLPYGCGSPWHNLCGFFCFKPAGGDREALPWACFCARLDGTVCTLAADDFKTYCLPGAGADCDQDEAWTREYLHA